MGFIRVTYNPVDVLGRATGATFHLHLPSRTVHERVLEQIRRQEPEGRAMTGPRAALRPVDDPLFGRVYILPQDERDAKYGKPWMVYDHQPGGLPRLYIGNGRHH